MIGLTAACQSTIPTCMRVGFNANATTPAPPAGAATCTRPDGRRARHGGYLCNRKNLVVRFNRPQQRLTGGIVPLRVNSVISGIYTGTRESRGNSGATQSREGRTSRVAWLLLTTLRRSACVSGSARQPPRCMRGWTLPCQQHGAEPTLYAGENSA
jgi:hypothetical protein